MSTSQRSKLVQVRVAEEDKHELDRLSAEQDQSLPKVIHQILEDRPKLGKNNLAYVQTEAQRTGKTIWQVLDRIVFEHQGREMFKRRSAYFRSQQDNLSQEDIYEIAAHHKHVAEQWADL